MNKEKLNRKKFHIILALCMALLVIVFDVLFFIIPDRAASETENRNLQQLPVLNWNTMTQGRFEAQFDDYVADQFPLRDAWIGMETTIQRLAGNTVSNNIYLASDGYLIQGFDYPSDDKYNEILESFTAIASDNSGLNLYAMIVPTAVTVLDYRLPANSRELAGNESAFIARLNNDLKNSGVKTIDVEETLRRLDSAGTQIYYRTDHHWTTDAAFEAYKVFVVAADLNKTEDGAGTGTLVQPDSTEVIACGVTYMRLLASDSFQGTLTASSGFRTGETDCIYVYLPKEPEDAVQGEPSVGTYNVINVDTGLKNASMYDLSFLETRDKYAMFLGGNHGELKIQTAAFSGGNILVIKDSYANCFIPFLAANYSNIIVVDPRYYLGDLQQLINDEEITDILFLYNAETL